MFHHETVLPLFLTTAHLARSSRHLRSGQTSCCLFVIGFMVPQRFEWWWRWRWWQTVVEVSIHLPVGLAQGELAMAHVDVQVVHSMLSKIWYPKLAAGHSWRHPQCLASELTLSYFHQTCLWEWAPHLSTSARSIEANHGNHAICLAICLATKVTKVWIWSDCYFSGGYFSYYFYAEGTIFQGHFSNFAMLRWYFYFWSVVAGRPCQDSSEVESLASGTASDQQTVTDEKLKGRVAVSHARRSGFI